MFLTKRHLDRRTVLKGMGVTLALPLLEAMVPARAARAQGAAGRVRFVCIEVPHGSAGSTAYGLKTNMWSPAGVGRDFDLSSTILAPLEPFKNDITIVSNTDCRNAEAFSAPEIGGDHFRSAAVFLTQAHPKQTQGSDLCGRHVDRSALRAAVRPGDGDPVDAAVHRERRPGRRLRVWLLVRLHRLDFVGLAVRAAADDPRPARGVRSALRRRRDACRAGGTAAGRPQHHRRGDGLGAAPEGRARPGRSGAPHRLSRRRPRDRAADPAGRGARTRAASRASCRERPRACPTRSKST